MKRKNFLRQFAWGMSSFTLCLVLYLSLAALMLGAGKTAVGSKAESVPYENTAKDFSILLECDELEQFCGIIVYPREKRINATLFSTAADAENYLESYTYRVKYAKNTEIDIIGRIGGIVIDAKKSYNILNSNNTEPERLFGSRVLELAKDPSLRIDIAHEFLYSLLGTTLDETDYSYIFASCSSNISYSDFSRCFSLMQPMRENIIVTLG